MWLFSTINLHVVFIAWLFSLFKNSICFQLNPRSCTTFGIYFTFSLAFCALGLQSQQPHTIFCRCPHAHVLCVYLIYVLCSYCVFICKIYLQLSYYYQPTRSRHDTTILGVLSDFKYVMLGWRQLFDESHLLAVCCWPQIDVFFARVWFVWKIRLAIERYAAPR